MAQVRETRTIHTVRIDIQDDILSGIEFGDEVEIVLQGRNGATQRKRLTPRDIAFLTEGDPRKGGRY